MAAVAPAAAKSCLLLTVLAEARGRPLRPAPRDPAPVLVRLLMLAAVAAVAPEILLAAAESCLCGLPPPVRVAFVPTVLPPVPGGSGSGLGVDVVCCRLTGDESPTAIRATDEDADVFCPVTNSCRIASSGFIRRSGSQRRHRERKLIKASSSHLSTCCSVFDDGRRLRPLDETVNLGLPSESKNSFFLVLFSIRCFSGGPKTSMMQANCSCSFSPGKIGTPVKSSARMQPTLHMSIGSPYVMPRITSGER